MATHTQALPAGSGGKIWSLGEVAKPAALLPTVSGGSVWSQKVVEENRKRRVAGVIFMVVSLAAVIGMIFVMQGYSNETPVTTADYLEYGSAELKQLGVIALALSIGGIIIGFALAVRLAPKVSDALLLASLPVLIIGGIIGAASGVFSTNFIHEPAMKAWTLDHLGISESQVQDFELVPPSDGTPTVKDGSTAFIQLKDGTEVKFTIHVNDNKYSVSDAVTRDIKSE